MSARVSELRINGSNLAPKGEYVADMCLNDTCTRMRGRIHMQPERGISISICVSICAPHSSVIMAGSCSRLVCQRGSTNQKKGDRDCRSRDTIRCPFSQSHYPPSTFGSHYQSPSASRPIRFRPEAPHFARPRLAGILALAGLSIR